MTTHTIRPYVASDHAALLALAPRLLIGVAPWINQQTMLRTVEHWISEAVQNLGSNRAIYVATDQDNQPIGFVSVSRQRHFAGEERAYIGELAVDERYEGLGIARSLLATVEQWASQQQLTMLELDTGAANHHARGLYAHLGYAEEGVKLVKLLL